MKSYNILVINWRDITNPEAGGAEVHLHEIFKRIVGMGHAVTLLTSGFPTCVPDEVMDGIKVMRRGTKFFFNYYVPFLCRKLLKQTPYDVIVDDINKVPFFTPLYVGRPILALAHHLFAETIFLEIAFPFSAYIYAGEKLIPFVYRKTQFTVVSDSTREDLVRRGIQRDDMEVIHNAVDHSLYNPGSRSKPEEPLIGYVGRIKRYKSIDHLVRAAKIVFARFPNARLEIAGTGDYLNPLVALVQQLGMADRVRFRGYVSEKEKVGILRRAHVVVNTSSKEGWGVTVIEANACGTPVIASDVPGLRDAVVDGKTGFLVPYGDISAFADKITEVLSDTALRAELSRGAMEWAKRFNWDDSAAATLRVIEEVLSARTESARHR
jgi:glycosyltransferase involved in cell wall biosynthesis